MVYLPPITLAELLLFLHIFINIFPVCLPIAILSVLPHHTTHTEHVCVLLPTVVVWLILRLIYSCSFPPPPTYPPTVLFEDTHWTFGLAVLPAFIWFARRRRSSFCGLLPAALDNLLFSGSCRTPVQVLVDTATVSLGWVGHTLRRDGRGLPPTTRGLLPRRLTHTALRTAR